MESSSLVAFVGCELIFCLFNLFQDDRCKCYWSSKLSGRKKERKNGQPILSQGRAV
jgi:hypothetical protein